MAVSVEPSQTETCNRADCINFGVEVKSCNNESCFHTRCSQCETNFVDKEGERCLICLKKDLSCVSCGKDFSELREELEYDPQLRSYICPECKRDNDIVERSRNKSVPCRICRTPYPRHSLSIHNVCKSCEKSLGKVRPCANPACGNEVSADENFCDECENALQNNFCTCCGKKIARTEVINSYGWCEICVMEEKKTPHKTNIVCRGCKESAEQSKKLAGFCKDCADLAVSNRCVSCHEKVNSKDRNENGLCADCAGEFIYECAVIGCHNPVSNPLEYCLDCKLQNEY